MGVRIEVQSLWTQTTDNKFDFEFEQQRVVIGRSGSADVQLPHAAVSLHHAIIERQGDRYVVQDQHSTNGTRVNGERIVSARPKVLQPGDVLSVGGFRLVVTLGTPITENTPVHRTASAARAMIEESLREQGERTEATLIAVEGNSKGTVFALPKADQRAVIGRLPHCEISLQDSEVSREHARIVANAEGFLIEDLGSKNPVQVNSQPKSRHRLRDGDTLQIGGTTLSFSDPTGRRLRELHHIPDDRVDILPVPKPPSVEAAVAATPALESLNEPHAPAPRSAMLVYALSAAVVIVSALVLFWLLRAR